MQFRPRRLADTGRTNRRRFLKLAGLGGLSLAVSACASDAPTPAPTPASAQDNAADIIKQEIAAETPTPAPDTTAMPGATRVAQAFDGAQPTVWMTIDSTEICARLDGISDAFAQNGGVRLNPVQCGGGTNSNFLPVWKSRMTQTAAPDGVFVFGDGLHDLIAEKQLTPVDDYLQTATHSTIDAWPAGLLRGAASEGKTYGLPVWLLPFTLYYNAGLFEKKGLSPKREDFPKTLDELRRLSKTLTTWKGDTLTSAGFLPGLTGVELHFWFALNGGGVYDSDGGTYVINQDRNVEMLQFLLDWYRDEYRGVAARARQTSGFTTRNGLFETPVAFRNGMLAVAEGTPFASEQLTREKLPENAANWDLAPYPTGPSSSRPLTSGFTFWGVIPTRSKFRDDVFRYIDYVSGPGTTDLQALEFGAFVPGNKTVQRMAGPAAMEGVRGPEFVAAWQAHFLRERDRMTVLDTSPFTGLAANMLDLELGDVLQGKGQARDALDRAQKLCQSRLEKAQTAK
jgi:ABC-type glycerol-3-phosphate transport system substrate-binding protein